MESLASLGQYSLACSLILSFLMPVSRRLKPLITAQFITILLSAICLVLVFYFSVFSVKLVYEHSYGGSPWFYKITAVWGNHEGSILLWILILSLCSLLEVYFGKNRGALLVQNCITAVFIIYLLFTSNPFETLPFDPGDGQGLNPLLRDMAMTFHPPLLYTGYVGLSMAFSYGVSFMIFPGKISPHKWISRMSLWCSFAWIFLTLGVVAGSYWAYYELGWGGFWFWDPVENASIMPWFMATATLHMLRIGAKTRNFYNWIVLLSIASFSLSVLGTFLVRSGLLVSVHTFASDPLRGLALLLIFSAVLLIPLAFFALRWKNLYRESWKVKPNTPMLLGVGVLVVVAFTILLGTLYPIGLEVVTGQRISVGAPYFQKVLFPFLVLAIILMSIATNRGNKTLLCGNLLISVAIMAVVGLMTMPVGWVGLASLMLGVWLALNTIFRMEDGGVVIRRKTGVFFAHLGFAVSIIAISAQAWETQNQSVMEVGDTMNIDSSYLKFKDVSVHKSSDYASLRGHLIYFENGDQVNLYPEVRYFYPSGRETTEVAFSSNLLRDVYLVMKRTSKSKYLIRAQKKPFLIWIWIGALIMVAGGVVSLVKYTRMRHEG